MLDAAWFLATAPLCLTYLALQRLRRRKQAAQGRSYVTRV